MSNQSLLDPADILRGEATGAYGTVTRQVGARDVATAGISGAPQDDGRQAKAAKQQGRFPLFQEAMYVDMILERESVRPLCC